MEDFPSDDDDDFGDLYADVELQAASAINFGTSSAKFHFPAEQKAVVQQDGAASNSKADNATTVSERENVSSRQNQSKLQNDSATVPSYSFKSMGRDSEGGEFLLSNVTNVNKVSNVYAAANSAAFHGGYGFSLPLYRTIYDVNTDTFGGKRWGYQGATMSRLPNFGFNEDGHRQYCMTEPKGRAIEVEDRGGERFPTMNQKCPDNWDSDVVIQIKVQDFDEKSSLFSKEDLSGKSSRDKASKSGVRSADAGAETSHSGGVSGDRVSLGSPVVTRSSQSLMETRESSQHLGNCERDHILDSDEHHPRRIRAKTAELAEVAESERDSEDGSGRSLSKSDQHQSDSDSLIDDKSRFSLTLSCSESDSEPSEDSCHGVSRCSSLGTVLHDTVPSRHCKSNGPEQRYIDRRCITDDKFLNGRRRIENEGDQRIKSEHDLDLPKRKDSSNYRSRDFLSGKGGQRRVASYVEADYRECPQKKRHQNLEGEAYTQDRGDCEADYREYPQKKHHQNLEGEAYTRDRGDCEADYREYPQKKRHQNLEGEAYTRDRGNCDRSARPHDRRISEILQPKHRYDSLNEEYGRRSPYSRREINPRERGLRHCENARLDLDHLWHEEEKMEREYWNAHHRDWNKNNQDPSFRSHTRSYTTNQSRCQNGNISKRYDQYEARVMESYSWPREDQYDSGTYGGFFSSESNFDSGFDDQHQLAKTKYVWRSGLRQGEESKPSHGGVQFYPDRFSCYGKALRHEDINGYGVLRERHSENLVSINRTYRCEREKMIRTYVDGPVGLVSQKVKLSGKQSVTGSLMPKSQPKKSDQKHMNAPVSGKGNVRQEKPQTQDNKDVMKRVGTQFQGKEQNNEPDIEEGEIITGEPSTKKVKAPQSENATAINKPVYDEQWIAERLAKMEKRRERFKVAVVVPEKVNTTDHIAPCSQPQVDLSVITGETELKRPARKRRWAGI